MEGNLETYLPKALPFNPCGKGDLPKILESRTGKEPEEYYLQPYKGVIHNQGYPYTDESGNTFSVGAGSCVADSFTAILEKIEHYKGGNIYPSVTMLYGTTSVNTGMFTYDASQALKNYGVLPFQYLQEHIPYMQVYTEAIEATSTTHNGKTYNGARNLFNELYSSKKEIMEKTKISSYNESKGKPTSEGSIGALQRAIKAQNQGAVFSIKIDDAFDYVGSTGVLKSADYKDNGRGYHLINIVGWVTIDGVLHWIIQNSWAQSWGDKGYCYMPYDWPGIEYYGILTGTDAPPLQLNDTPKKAVYTTPNGYNYFTWDSIPNAVSYEYQYKQPYWWYDGTTTTNSIEITNTVHQFQYRAVFANGTKGLWSEQLRVLVKPKFYGLNKPVNKVTHYRSFLEIPSCLYYRTITVTDKDGQKINYEIVDGDELHIPIPNTNSYCDIKVDLDYLLEAQFGKFSETFRIYGEFAWQYMKDDTNKEVKITAKEWNDVCDRIDNLARITVNVPRVKSGEYISADVFNKMIDTLTTGFIIGFLIYIDKKLIPTKVTSQTPITKQHFIQLKNAINSASI